MTSEREKLIRETWANCHKVYRYRSVVCFVQPLVRGDHHDDEVPSVPFERLEYRVEHGSFDGRSGRRIVCEDVVVEMEFL